MCFNIRYHKFLFYCDLSHSGCGAWAECGDIKFNYAWTDTEISKSSTWRELKGIALALIAFSPRLKGKCKKCSQITRVLRL